MYMFYVLTLKLKPYWKTSSMLCQCKRFCGGLLVWFLTCGCTAVGSRGQQITHLHHLSWTCCSCEAQTAAVILTSLFVWQFYFWTFAIKHMPDGFDPCGYSHSEEKIRWCNIHIWINRGRKKYKFGSSARKKSSACLCFTFNCKKW